MSVAGARRGALLMAVRGACQIFVCGPALKRKKPGRGAGPRLDFRSSLGNGDRSNNLCDRYETGFRGQASTI